MLRTKVWLTLKQIKSGLPTEEAIRSMPQVMDPVVACKMELVQKAATLAFTADKTYLYILLCCESAKHISEHGLTDTSAASISSFANVLMHTFTTTSRPAPPFCGVGYLHKGSTGEQVKWNSTAKYDESQCVGLDSTELMYLEVSSASICIWLGIWWCELCDNWQMVWLVDQTVLLLYYSPGTGERISGKCRRNAHLVQPGFHGKWCWNCLATGTQSHRKAWKSKYRRIGRRSLVFACNA